MVILVTGASSGVAAQQPVIDNPIDTNQTDPQVDDQWFNTSELTLKVPTGEVPFYFFWENGQNSSTHIVQFEQMFEAIDNNSNEAYEQNETRVADSALSLASMNWEMSELETSSEGDSEITSFNFTGTPQASVISGDLMIQFRNHLNVTGNNTDIKFDVVVNNYEFNREKDDTLLVLAYHLQSAQNVAAEANNDTSTQFGNAYFNSEPTASNMTGEEVSNNVNASLSTAEQSEEGMDQNSRIYLSYTYFQGNLTHDPTIGVDQGMQMGEETIEADNLTLKVPTAQVPFYEFWRTDTDDASMYRVQFDQLFEASDFNADGDYDQATDTLIGESLDSLSSWSWEMSDLRNETSSYHFNLTGMSGDMVVQFNNHIELDGNDTEVKFDILINNYEWTSDSEDTLLTLAFKLQVNGSDYNASPDANSTTVDFQDAYFNSSSTATNSSSNGETDDVDVGLTTGSGNSENASDNAARVYISYSQFAGNLTHDPSLGLSETTASDTGGNGDNNSDTDNANFVHISGIFALIVAVPVLRKGIKQRR